MSISNLEIGKNLRAIRKERGVSQSEIAALLGITYQQVQKQERGKNRISAEALLKLQKFYRIPFDIFFYSASADSKTINACYSPETWEIANIISKISNDSDKEKLKKIIHVFID